MKSPTDPDSLVDSPAQSGEQGVREDLASQQAVADDDRIGRIILLAHQAEENRPIP